MNKIDWEMLAVMLTLFALFYHVGKKEERITTQVTTAITEVQKNTSAIDQLSDKVDDLAHAVDGENNTTVSYDLQERE